ILSQAVTLEPISNQWEEGTQKEYLQQPDETGDNQSAGPGRQGLSLGEATHLADHPEGTIVHPGNNHRPEPNGSKDIDWMKREVVTSNYGRYHRRTRYHSDGTRSLCDLHQRRKPKGQQDQEEALTDGLSNVVL